MKKESRPPAREPRRHWMDLKNMLLPMLEPYRAARANIVQGPQGPGPPGQGTQGRGTRGQGTRGRGTRGQGTQGQGTLKTMLQSAGQPEPTLYKGHKVQGLQDKGHEDKGHEDKGHEDKGHEDKGH
ncbi:ribosome-binding protein 1-like isoform X4 [Lineus longissimus]|uniref:ribosome-binding protein 1-like isoform X4 n=1 Tax=Lineus longissimus TaxID=88925 RepID=UPI00315D96DF